MIRAHRKFHSMRSFALLVACVMCVGLGLMVVAWADRASGESPLSDAEWVLEAMNLPPDVHTRSAAVVDDERAFDQILRARLAAIPPVQGYQHRAKNHPQTVADYHAGRLKLGVNAPVEFALPLDWQRTDQGLNFSHEMHALQYLSNFANAYEETGDQQYRKVVDDVLTDWLAKNPRTPVKGHPAWREGPATLRTLVLLNLLDYYETIDDRPIDDSNQPTLAELLRLIHTHAEFLASGQVYRAQGNHGVRQDVSLLTASLCLPDFKRAPHWQATALDRLRTRQVDAGFSREGVWPEHSPAYHAVMMLHVRDLLSLMENHGLSAEADFLRGLTRQSEHYFSHVLTPEGKYPPVGDSNEIAPPADLITGPAAQYAASRGKEGSPPTELDGFFPDTGVVVFRDTWGRPGRSAGEAIYVHLHAADHRAFGHKHTDELSFVMHGLGRWWILEGGKYGYDAGPLRDFLRSAHAHNGVTFNQKALTALERNDASKTARVEDVLVSLPELAAARAWTTRFPDDGVRVTRTCVFLRERSTLVLLDQCEAPQSGSWQARIHLAPDAEYSIEESGVSARVPTHPQAQLDVVFEAGLSSLEVRKGQQEPLMGWYSPVFKELVPTPVIVAERKGSQGVFATVIRLQAERDETTLANLKTTVDESDRMATIAWTEGLEQHVLKVALDSPLRVWKE